MLANCASSKTNGFQTSLHTEIAQGTSVLTLMSEPPPHSSLTSISGNGTQALVFVFKEPQRKLPRWCYCVIKVEDYYLGFLLSVQFRPNIQPSPDHQCQAWVPDQHSACRDIVSYDCGEASVTCKAVQSPLSNISSPEGQVKPGHRSNNKFTLWDQAS